MMRVRYNEHIAVFPQLPRVYVEGWLDEMRRANGRAICGICRKPYDEHPCHPDFLDIPTLVVTCDGDAVKT